MRRWRGLALACALGAAASLAWGAIQGKLQVALFLVFPVVYGSGPWGVLGIGLLVAAFLALFLDAAAAVGQAPGPSEPRRGPGGRGDPGGPASDPFQGPHRDEADPWDEDREESGGWFRGGGVVMLGPIPIVLGSDKRTTMILMGLAVLLMALGLAWLVLVR